MVNLMMANNNVDDPFADYMWMGEMDKFDQQVVDDFQEEDFIKSCIEQLLDEEEEQTVYYENSSGGINEVTYTPPSQTFDPNYVEPNSYYNDQYNQEVPVNGMDNLAQNMNSMYIQQNNQNNSQNTTQDNVEVPPSKPISKQETDIEKSSKEIPSKSKLNVNAQPFTLNVNAKPFSFQPNPQPHPRLQQQQQQQQFQQQQQMLQYQQFQQQQQYYQQQYVNAPPFSPQQGFTTRPSNMVYEQPSHSKPKKRFGHHS